MADDVPFLDQYREEQLMDEGLSETETRPLHEPVVKAAVTGVCALCKKTRVVRLTSAGERVCSKCARITSAKSRDEVRK